MAVAKATATSLFMPTKEQDNTIMEKEKLNRINELARKSKAEPLSESELAEQKALREEYLREIRLSFGAMLDNTVIQYPDGSRKSLKKEPEDR